MTRTTRRLLFYGLVVVFLFLGSGVVLYTQGWRFNVTTFTFKKVGAIFVRSFPADAEIHLNRKPIQNNSWFLSNGTFVNNLTPGTYDLVLSSYNYHTWHSRVTVLPSLVKEFDSIVLVPENSTSTGKEPVQNFWLIGDQLLTQDAIGTLLWQDGKIPGSEVIDFTPDVRTLLTHDEKTKTYFLNDLVQRKSLNVTAMLISLGFNTAQHFRLMTDPTQASALIVLTPRGVSLLDVGNMQVVPLAAGTPQDGILPGATGVLPLGGHANPLAVSSGAFTWTLFNEKANSSTLITYDKLQNAEMSRSSKFPGENIKLEWIDTTEIALLQNDGGLYLFDTAAGELKKIADDVKDFEASSDHAAVAALEHNALEIIPLKQSRMYQKFSVPDMGTVQAVVWYADAMHLFIVYPHRVAFLDINDRGLENFAIVAETSLSRYDASTNRFYFLKDNRVFQLDFPR